MKSIFRSLPSDSQAALLAPCILLTLVLSLSQQPVLAQSTPDAHLYYRRTHNGAWPPAGVDPSDHTGETTAVLPATTENVAKPVVSRLVLDNGVVATNLGKGDWIWDIPSCQSALDVPDVQGIIDYEKSHGMQWVTVKCGDGGTIYTQFTADLVNRAHTAGMKIFGWAYAYGANVAGEINVAINALNLGADGFIIDAESEYEVLANNDAAAAQYCQGIRASYPNRFLAHAPFPIISVHTGFPYETFGTNCDAVMPQDYWADIGGTNYPVTMVTRMNTEWRNWQNGLTGVLTNAIKPIAPIGQGYNHDITNGLVYGTQVSTFLNALKTNTPPATTGGFQGVSFWSCQHHLITPDKWPAIGVGLVGTPPSTPCIVTPPVNRVVDTGSATTLSVLAGGATNLTYQWRLNGTNVPTGISSAYTVSNAQTTNAGNYTVVIANTNTGGSITSSPVSLLVYPLQTVAFADTFDSNTAANWITNRSSTDTRVTFNYDYSADGIPSAPHSTGGTTRGMKLEANFALATVAAISMSPVGQIFSGDYRLHFDMWINVNGPLPAGGPSSTESITAGIGTRGTNTQWSTSGDGIWFAVDGEGGIADTSSTPADYGAYSGTTLQAASTGVYAAGTDTYSRGNGKPYYVAAFPGAKGPPASQHAAFANQYGVLAVGTVGFAWRDVIVSRRGNIVDWSIDGIRICSVSNVTFTGSNVFVGFWDPFASLTDHPQLSFGLVDNVKVEVPVVSPSITAPPTNLTVVQGSNATFNVTASGVPPPGYQWRFNGTNISAATASAYTRSNAQPADAGPYTVVATNIGGSVTSATATLTVIVPPSITMHPQSQTTNSGSTVTFTVSANGDLPLTYQWQREGTNISATGTSFTIANVLPADAGNYRAVVTNIAGSATSSNALLTVNVAPGITTQPQSVTANPGATVVFSVLADGTPPPTYQWRREGTNIAGTGSSYTINNAQTADAGLYSVVVSNVAGSVTSSNAELSINVAPGISVQPQDVAVKLSSNATFTVTATGTLPLSYQWQFNGTDISGATTNSYTRANVWDPLESTCRHASLSIL